MKHLFTWIRSVQYFSLVVVTFQLVIWVECSEYKTIDVDNTGSQRLAYKENYQVNNQRNDKPASYYMDYSERGFPPTTGTRTGTRTGEGSLDVHGRFRTRPDVESFEEPEVSSSTYHTNTPTNFAQTRISHDRPDPHRAYVTVDTSRKDKEHTVTINMPRMSRKIKKFVIQPVIQYVVQYDKKRQGRPEVDALTAAATSQYEQYNRNRGHQRLRRGHEQKVDRFFNDANANFESYWDNQEESGGTPEEDYSPKENADEDLQGGAGSDYDSGSHEEGGEYMTTKQMHQPPSVDAYIPSGGYGENNSGFWQPSLLDNVNSGINSAHAVQINPGAEQVQNQIQHTGPNLMQNHHSAVMINTAMGNFRGTVGTNAVTQVATNQNALPAVSVGNSVLSNGKDGNTGFFGGMSHFAPNGMISNVPTAVIGSTRALTTNLHGSQQGPSSPMSMGHTIASGPLYGVPGQTLPRTPITMHQLIPSFENGGGSVSLPVVSSIGLSVSSKQPAVVQSGMGMPFGHNSEIMTNVSPGNFMIGKPVGEHVQNILENVISDAPHPTVFTTTAQVQRFPANIVQFATSGPNFHKSKTELQGGSNMAANSGTTIDSPQPSNGPQTVNEASDDEIDTSLEDDKNKPLRSNRGKNAGDRGKSKGRRGRGGKRLLQSLRFPKLPPNIGGHLSFMFSTGFGKGRRRGLGGRGGGLKQNGYSTDGKSQHKMIDMEQVSNEILNILGLTVHHHRNSGNNSTVLNFSNNSSTNNPILLWEEQGNRTSLINLTSHVHGVIREFVTHLPVPKTSPGPSSLAVVPANISHMSYVNATFTPTTIPSITTTVENDTKTSASVVTKISSLSSPSPTASTTVVNIVEMEASTPSTTANNESHTQNTNDPLIAEETAFSHPSSIIFAPQSTFQAPFLNATHPSPLNGYMDKYNLSRNHYSDNNSNQSRDNIDAYYAEDGYPGNPIKIMQFDPWIYDALQAAFQPDHDNYNTDE